MRTHYYAIAVFAALIAGFGTKHYFFPPMQAKAVSAQTSQIMDVRALEATIDIKSLPNGDVEWPH
jgi:hypothetical protein